MDLHVFTSTVQIELNILQELSRAPENISSSLSFMGLLNLTWIVKLSATIKDYVNSAYCTFINYNWKILRIIFKIPKSQNMITKQLKTKNSQIKIIICRGYKWRTLRKQTTNKNENIKNGIFENPKTNTLLPKTHKNRNQMRN